MQRIDGRQRYAAEDSIKGFNAEGTDDDGVLHKLRLQHEMQKDLQGFDRITYNANPASRDQQQRQKQQSRKKGSGPANNTAASDGSGTASAASRFFDESSISLNGQQQFAGFSMDGMDVSIELGRGKEMGSPGHLMSSPMAHSDTDMFLEDFKQQNATRDWRKKQQMDEKENKKTTLSEVFDRIKTTDLTSGSESDGNHRAALKPKSSNVPRSFRNSAKLMQDLNIDEEKKNNASFKLPNIPDLTMLLSDGVDTGNHAFAYKKIESIPIPEDEQAILANLKDLKSKFQSLEMENAKKTSRVVQLENQLRRGENAFSENEPKDFTMARMKLDRRIAILSSKIELLQAQLDSAQVFSHKATEERNEAIKLLSKSQEKAEKMQIESKLLKRDAIAYKKLYQEALVQLKPETELKPVAQRVKSRVDGAKHWQPKRQFRQQDDEGIGRGDGSFSMDDSRDMIREAPNRREERKQSKAPLVTRVGRHRVSVEVESVASDEEGYSSAPVHESRVKEPKVHKRIDKPRVRTVSAPAVQNWQEDNTGPIWINADVSAYEFDKETGLSSKAHSILRRLTSHNPSQCSVCARNGTSFYKFQNVNKIDGNEQNAGLRFEDELSIRPSQDPMDALQSVITQLEDEMQHLKRYVYIYFYQG